MYILICVYVCLYIAVITQKRIILLYYDNASTAALEPRSPYQRATRKTLLESLTLPRATATVLLSASS